MALSEVFEICYAYEQGYCQGFNDEKLENPYDINVKCCEAWSIGYFAGKKKHPSDGNNRLNGLFEN
mgnify:CR=1 FL=1